MIGPLRSLARWLIAPRPTPAPAPPRNPARLDRRLTRVWGDGVIPDSLAEWQARRPVGGWVLASPPEAARMGASSQRRDLWPDQS